MTENNARTPETVERGQQARLSRFIGRQALRTVTTVERCGDCGRKPLGTAVAMRKTDDGIVGYAGLESCGRVWLCPVCNAKVMATRAVEIGAALSWAGQTGRHVIWGSLTCRHTASSTLDELIAIQREAWRYVVSSREWRDANATRTVPHVHVGCQNDCQLEHEHTGCPYTCDRKRDVVLTQHDGRVGYIRASELTVGRNGWHPHFHPLIVWQGSQSDAEAFAQLVVRLWVEGVEKAGGEARAIGGQQLRVVSGVEVFDSLTGYVTKSTFEAASLALEAVWSQGKSGRGRAHETSSHWSLLVAIEQGLADDVERWWELEAATKGHRLITWSRGLRDFAGLGLEVDDETEASREVGTVDDTVCYITPEGWMGVRDRPEVIALMLNALESGGWPVLRTVLEAYGVDHFQLEPAS